MEKNVKKDKTTNSKKKVEKKEPLKKEEKVINTKNSKNISLKETKKKDTDIKHLTYDNDTNRKICYAFLIGVIITIIVVIIIWPKKYCSSIRRLHLMFLKQPCHFSDVMFHRRYRKKDTKSVRSCLNGVTSTNAADSYMR